MNQTLICAIVLFLFLVKIYYKIILLCRKIDQYYSNDNNRFICTKSQMKDLNDIVKKHEIEIMGLKQSIKDLNKSPNEGNMAKIEIVENQTEETKMMNENRIDNQSDETNFDKENGFEKTLDEKAANKKHAKDNLLDENHIEKVDEIDNVMNNNINIQSENREERYDDEEPFEILFDLKKDNQQNLSIEYTLLKVIDGGNLVIRKSEDSAYYYRSWKEGQIIKFEFCSEKTAKAINNRTSLIEPFCNIDEGSLHPDIANDVINVCPGILNEDLSVKEKILIKYN